MERIAGAEAKNRQMVIVDGRTHQEVSEEGLSFWSVRRFCAKHDIHRTFRLEVQQLARIVANGVSRVEPTYGRKTMKGFLASQGIRAGQWQIAAVMPYVNPAYHHQRQADTARLLNPIPYSARYFGHKLHIDQNEKMVMFGDTHVRAIDGFSGRIVVFASMPIKNNVDIYEHNSGIIIFALYYMIICTCIPCDCMFMHICMCMHVSMAWCAHARVV